MRELINKIKLLLKTNRVDALVILSSIILCLLFIEIPKDSNGQNIKNTTSEKKEQSENTKENENVEEQGDVEDIYRFIKERNIFAQDGKYFTPNVLQQLPEKPYNLIAIFKGTEKRALFKDYKGNMIFVKEGDKLIDDAVITEIGITSVKITKEEDIKELKVFDVIPKKDEIKKNP
ncbi:MAG: hypothetical protein N2738_07145 [Thermodesulfovibrionales bacterium]|nr:hypothetical protein [Thermodesulfovibrionales bacterium]